MNDSTNKCTCNCNETPKIRECAGSVVSNKSAGDALYIMRIAAPSIAQSVQPGQFVHLQIPCLQNHILRRPFSVYAANAAAGTIDILYQVVGQGTRAMTDINPLDSLSVMGPIGQGWEIPKGTRRAMLVGGGVGAAPLYMLCEQCLNSGIKTTVVLGAAASGKLATRNRFAHLLGEEPLCATDDGSFGHAGFCTEVAAAEIERAAAESEPFDWIACCGPTPVMKIVAGLARDAKINCHVSMEEHMACGVGACLGCIVKTKNGNARACVDGPVFCASDIVWG